jgi:hypothetical protein
MTEETEIARHPPTPLARISIANGFGEVSE